MLVLVEEVKKGMVLKHSDCGNVVVIKVISDLVFNSDYCEFVAQDCVNGNIYNIGYNTTCQTYMPYLELIK